MVASSEIDLNFAPAESAQTFAQFHTTSFVSSSASPCIHTFPCTFTPLHTPPYVSFRLKTAAGSWISAVHDVPLLTRTSFLVWSVKSCAANVFYRKAQTVVVLLAVLHWAGVGATNKPPGQ